MIEFGPDDSMDAQAYENVPGQTRGRVLTALRILAISVPVAFLVGRVDPAELPAAVGRVGVSGLLAAFALMVASVTVGALRWRALMRAFGVSESVEPKLGELVRHIFVGLYFAMIPSGIVGEVLRARRTAHVFDEKATPYVVILVDRAAASFGLLTLGLLGVFATSLGQGQMAVLGGLRIGLVLAWLGSVFVIAIPFGFGSVAMRARVAAIPRIGPVLVHVVATPELRRIAGILALSVAIEMLTSAAVVATVLPFATPRQWIELALLAPGILLLTFMPITPGAFGQRELAFVALLAPIGIAAADATAASIVTLAVSLLLALVGLVCLLAERRPRSGQPTGP